MTFPPNKLAVEAAAKERVEMEYGDDGWDRTSHLEREWQVKSMGAAITAYHASLEAQGLARKGSARHHTGSEHLPDVDYWQAATNGAAEFDFPVLIIKTGEA